MKKVIICLAEQTINEYSNKNDDKFFDVFLKRLKKKYRSVNVEKEMLTKLIININTTDANDEVRSAVISAMLLKQDDLDNAIINVFNVASVDEEKIENRKENGKQFVNYINSINELKTTIENNVYGQQHVVDSVISGLINAYSFENNCKKPLTFTFLGAHGVGKTYMAEIIASFFENEMGIPSLIFNRDDYNMNFGDRMARFVDGNRKCVIVCNDAEEFSASISSIFEEIYLSCKYKSVPFKDVTFIFTTYAGESIYKSSLSGNMSHVSNDDIKESLINEYLKDAYIGNFSKDVVIWLTQGICCMFNFLAPYTIKQIIEEKAKEKLQNFTEKTNIEINCDLDKLSTTLFYVNKREYNVKSLLSCLNGFIEKELSDIFIQLDKKTKEPMLAHVQNINFDFDIENASQEVNDLFDIKKLKAIVISNKKDANFIKQLPVENIEFTFVNDDESAKKALKEKVDFILFDVLFDMNNNNKHTFTNIADLNTNGVKLFNFVATYYNEYPLYIISNSNYDKVYDDYTSFIGKGAKDVLFYNNDDLESFLNGILSIEKSIDLSKDIAFLIKNKKVLSHNSMQKLSNDGKSLNVMFSNMELTYGSHDFINNSLASSANNAIYFDDIIGNETAVKTLKYYGEFLKNSKKYLLNNIRAPKGVLLYGYAGIGKMYMLKALANETNATIIEKNAFDIISQQGFENISKTIHELFVKAHDNSPSIIIIENINEMAFSSNNYEVKRIVRFLINEMDNCNADDKHPVLFACTSNDEKDYLDSEFIAKLDRALWLSLPNEKERELFIRKCFKKYNISEISDEIVNNLAIRCIDENYTNIENIIEFVLKYSKGEKITDEMIINAFDLYLFGDETLNPEDYSMATSYHEVGHLLIDILLGNHPSFVTIVSRGDFGGYTMSDTHENDKQRPKQYYLDKICMGFGGRAAEELIYGETGINYGAIGDIHDATKKAKFMVCELGMGSSLMSMSQLKLS